MVAQARGHLPDTSTIQQTDGRIAQERHDGWPLAAMDQAVVLTEEYILATVQPVLDAPMPTFEGQQPRWRSLIRPDTGDAVAQLSLRTSTLDPGALDPENLCDTRPVEVVAQIGAQIG